MTDIKMKKKKRKSKDVKIEVRVDKVYKNGLKQKALLYCDGNLSEFILCALDNYVPRREDLEIKNP